MKFKLGVVVGATAGYLVGSGKGAEMWSEYRARAKGAGGSADLLNEPESLLDFSDSITGEPLAVDGFIVTAEPLTGDF
ncbi:MAG: hypothetical protein JWL70_2791 [Acidimicrobiia bacterium]|nr:hypothetical protein [Acidimicrobiia bacterium]